MASATNGIRRYPLIQRGEFALLEKSQTQEVDVGNLSMGDDGIRQKDF